MTIISVTDKGIDDPKQQIWFWINFDLLDMQRDYALGDQAALLKAVALCARMQIPLPKWVADDYCKRLDAWLDLEVKELGEAFNVSWPKGKSIAAARKRRKNRLDPQTIFRDVWYYSRTLGYPIDNELFEMVARDHCTNKTEVARLYAIRNSFEKRLAKAKHQKNA